jgi:hypothetical protein
LIHAAMHSTRSPVYPFDGCDTAAMVQRLSSRAESHES